MVLLQARKEISSSSVGGSSQCEDLELCVIHKGFRHSSYAWLMASMDKVAAGLSETLAVGGNNQHLVLRLPLPVYTQPRESQCRGAEEFTFLCYDFYSY